jgi:hypothetical protein
MDEQTARRSPGRPRKHANATERNAAWRKKHRLVKVTVEVPQSAVEQIRWIARQFRSKDSLAARVSELMDEPVYLLPP